MGASAAIGVEAANSQARDSSSREARRPGVLQDASSPARMRALNSLDVWLAERFRGVQLLPDTAAGRTSDMADGAPARIESARAGNNSDTLFALHFAARPANGALESGRTVQLAGPTGTVAPLAGTVLARRAFRAPRTPQANANIASGDKANDASWRYGWAYIVSLPKAGRITPATTFRGWLLLDGGAPK
jgi:hypothetical protein